MPYNILPQYLDKRFCKFIYSLGSDTNLFKMYNGAFQLLKFGVAEKSTSLFSNIYDDWIGACVGVCVGVRARASVFGYIYSGTGAKH